MTKPTIVTNSKEAVEIMASETMPECMLAVRFEDWVIYCQKGQEPIVMTQAEVDERAAKGNKGRK